MFQRILKTVLNVILFIVLVILSYLTIIRGVLFENVEAKTTSLTIEEIEKISNYTKEDVHKVLDGILKENDIPINIIDEILTDKEEKQIIDDYMNEVKSSLKKGNDLPEIPTAKIENLLNSSIQKYNQKYQSNISFTKVQKVVNELSEKANMILNFANQNLNILGKIRFIFHDKVYYSFLIITLILILVIAIIFKREALFSLGGISIFNGLVLIITYFILKLSQLQNILEFLPFSLKELKQSCLLTGIIFIITGILLFILYRILLIHEEKKKKSPSY